MSDFDQLSLKQVNDLGNKIGGQERAKRFMSGELVLVEKNNQISVAGLANGGVTYASGLDTKAFLEDWTRFYQEIFGLAVDLSQILLPPTRQGFGWGVAVSQGVTKQQAFTKYAELNIPSRRHTSQDFGTAVPDDKDERTAVNGDYVVWCRDRVEADEELKNLSANKIKERNTDTTTLLERLLLGLWFYWKTGGKHLDTKNYTNCTGSRHSDGSVPAVYLRGDGEVRVSWCSPDDHHDCIRSREVVSVPTVQPAA